MPQVTLTVPPGAWTHRTQWMLNEFDALYSVREAQEDGGESFEPLLVVDEIPIFDSLAQLLFVGDRVAEPKLAPSRIDTERRLYLHWLTYTLVELAPLLSVIYRQHRFGAYTVELAVEARGLLVVALRPVVELLGETEYVLRSGFSVADVALGDLLYAADGLGVLDGLKNIQSYLGRIETREAFVKTYRTC